jgi:hypothetical protein
MQWNHEAVLGRAATHGADREDDSRAGSALPPPGAGVWALLDAGTELCEPTHADTHAHGAFTITGGLEPLLHLRSFERFFGPKTNRWLKYTVAGLLTSIGYAQWRAGTSGDWRHARRLGVPSGRSCSR